MILLPIIALNLVGVWIMRENVKKEALSQVTALAQTSARNYEHHIRVTEDLFQIILRLPALKSMDLPTLTYDFEQIIKNNPMYASFLIVDPQGKSIVSGVPIAKPIDASDRAYFKDAIQEKNFVIGEFNVSRTTGKPVLHLAQAILDEKNKILGVLIAGLDLNWFAKMTPLASLPSHSSIIFIDRFGKTLYHSDDPLSNFGNQSKEFQFLPSNFLEQKSGTFET